MRAQCSHAHNDDPAAAQHAGPSTIARPARPAIHEMDASRALAGPPLLPALHSTVAIRSAIPALLTLHGSWMEERARSSDQAVHPHCTWWRRSRRTTGRHVAAAGPAYSKAKREAKRCRCNNGSDWTTATGYCTVQSQAAGQVSTAREMKDSREGGAPPAGER
jgi:hypothetical protein